MTALNIIGIDVGGTKISAGLVENGAIVSDVYKVATPKSAQEILQAVCGCIDHFTNQFSAPIDCAGIATAGAVDVERGQVISATENLASGYAGINYRERIREQYGCYCFVDNDANAAAFAEHQCGAAKGTQHSITITFGTGVGSGIIINGEVYRGNRFFAGECGHIAIDLTGARACTCGGAGCWEAYAAGRGLEKTYQLIVSQQGNNPQISFCHEILHAIEQSDPVALAAYEQWHQHISAGIINVIYMLSPEMIVLGGGMAKFIQLERIQGAVKARIPFEVSIAKASFDNNSGIIGAALLAGHQYLINNNYSSL